MRNLIIILILFLSSAAFSQINSTSAQWEEDLRFLQNTVHKDYPFLFKKTSAENFNNRVEELSKNIPKLKEHEIITKMASLVSSFKYGHTKLDWSNERVGFHQLPVNFQYFKDGIFVQGAMQKDEKIVGAKLVAVEGVPVEEVVKKIYEVVPAENDQYFKAYGINYIRVPEILHTQGIIEDFSTEVNFTFQQDGKNFNHRLSSLDDKENMHTGYGFVFENGNWTDAREDRDLPLYLRHLDNKIYYYEYLPEHNAVYVRHSQIQDDPEEPISAFYERLFKFIDEKQVNRLILDYRLNGGGNNYKNKSVITEIIKSQRINKTGNLFVILGKRTFSACQNLVNELDNYTNAIFIGEPTAENINFYGDNRLVELPNSGIPVYLSFAWWQDKPQWENADWLAPHIAVEMRFDDYRMNRDPVLQAALEFSDKDFIRNPMDHLTTLFMAGKLEEVEKEATRFVNDSRYKFFDFENQFNRAGYNLLGSDRVEEAKYVFGLNAKLFPDSPISWGSLAEAYLKLGDKEMARKYYEKAIQLDPYGNTGAHAKSMLTSMDNK
jgi:tetratricopeptide (TPR) repeat protein